MVHAVCVSFVFSGESHSSDQDADVNSGKKYPPRGKTVSHKSLEDVLQAAGNPVNHLRNSLQAVNRLTALLRPRGRIALGQSSLLPDMYFAWDSRLERVTNEAVRQYYRDRYSLDERDLTSVRAIVGVLRAANLQNVGARTVLIERVSPVDAATERYLLETIFRDTWGERLRSYLADDDYAELVRLCDPQHPQFALRRPDFHFLQSFTLVTGEV